MPPAVLLGSSTAHSAMLHLSDSSSGAVPFASRIDVVVIFSAWYLCARAFFSAWYLWDWYFFASWVRVWTKVFALTSWSTLARGFRVAAANAYSLVLTFVSFAPCRPAFFLPTGRPFEIAFSTSFFTSPFVLLSKRWRVFAFAFVMDAW